MLRTGHLAATGGATNLVARRTRSRAGLAVEEPVELCLSVVLGRWRVNAQALL